MIKEKENESCMNEEIMKEGNKGKRRRRRRRDKQ